MAIWVFSQGEVAYAPNCRRSMMIMDKRLPEPEPDGRVSVLSNVVANLVIEFGHAEVTQVPDDQQQRLRQAIRRSLRERTDESVQTHYRSNVVHVICEEIYKEHELEYGREAAAVLSTHLAGEPVVRERPEWRLTWDAWDIS